MLLAILSAWRRTKRVNWADLEKRRYLEERPHLPPCKRPVKFGPILVKAHILLPPPENVNIDAVLSSKSSTDLKSTAAATVREIANHAGSSEGTPPSENSRQNQQWKWDFQNLWIHNNMPCIEVSEDELGALALVMGIPLHCSERESPCGPSAFSPCLSSTADGGCLKRLKFTYGRCRSTSPNAGSGYSILFAKYLGCSCLPFAREYVPSVLFKEAGYKLEVLHAVHVTWEVLSLIKQGNPIWTNPRGPDFTTASSKYLARLPTLAVPYLYDFGNVNGEQVSTEDNAGCIYKKFKNDNSPPQLVGSWTKAVARIAFGGLVPMAAKPLIDALLVDLVMQRTNKEIGSDDSGIPLFGFERQMYSDMAAGRDKMDVNISLKNGGRIMEIVHVLVRYNTLLERLMAMMAAPDEEDRQTQVYSILCRRIFKCYKSAYKKEKEGQDNGKGLAENGTQPKNKGNALKRVKNAAAESWTCIAKIVDWREAGDPEDKSHQEQEGHMYKPVPFANLPDVALWE
ncbi:hypothetical protein L207DRAFT_583428 [Hyaloscypha variabilis F]|uniref:Uncharacterized protein n=1 Tax=Hyaloscypha variabilis (strain UAMH 11265 / GT02V1 / F) TaxID=1149755 RepID=A0A2J6RM17_HYAVF|nr:hypothetical protein L207DRAFT_583428 [Hyaloscypha variabilis F]